MSKQVVSSPIQRGVCAGPPMNVAEAEEVTAPSTIQASAVAGKGKKITRKNSDRSTTSFARAARDTASAAAACAQFPKASAAIDGWQNNPAARRLFRSVVEYEAYLNGQPAAAIETKLRNGLKLSTILNRADQVFEAKRANFHQSVGLTPDELAADKGRLPSVEAREFWSRSPAVRAEFKGNFESYFAYRQAQAHPFDRG